MLKKVRQISMNMNSGAIQFDDKIIFQEGDHNTAVLQLRGELDNSIKVVLRVKPPQGELQEVEGKAVPYKSIAREFDVPTDKGTGIYQAQIMMKYSYETNISEIFEYTVQESLK